ncbi:MAG: LacI family transcriptional regulator [Sulfurimonas sp.]|nr:MAG: LacI family transcriptional regulator [Sulfurimonas sp.]
MMIRAVLLVLLCSITPFAAVALDSHKKYTIAFAQDTLDNDFRLAQVTGVRNALSKYPNIHFVYSNAKASTALQIKQIEDFIYQGVDLLITSPYNEIATTDVVAKAYKSGIPVIMLDRSVRGNDYTVYIHPDNKKIARDAAEFLAKQLHYKGTVLLLKGVPSTDSTRKRTEGFYEIMQQYPQINVLEYTANYLRRDALIGVDKLLKQGRHFDAIMSQSDSMLIGARIALNDHGIDPSSLVSVGIDYIKPARCAIRSGRQTSSFLYALGAKESADIAMKILAGEPVPKEIILESLQVTRDNADVIEPIF